MTQNSATLQSPYSLTQQRPKPNPKIEEVAGGDKFRQGQRNSPEIPKTKVNKLQSKLKNNYPRMMRTTRERKPYQEKSGSQPENPEIRQKTRTFLSSFLLIRSAIGEMKARGASGTSRQSGRWWPIAG
ncbi:hypothetical protein ACLB2K_004401 [Fragaria x ananassa]